jgi:hypothetical protein
MNEPVIECETESHCYDLHNAGDFRGVEWTPPGALAFRFVYDPDHLHTPGEGDLRTALELRFTGVRSLHTVLAPDFAVESSALVEHWVWNRVSDELGGFEFKVGELTLNFRATAVELITAPEPL